MIETIAACIEPRLHSLNGRVFYSGRAAWDRLGGLFVLGFNPGGDPVEHPGETVSRHTEFVLNEAPDAWSAYCDESWTGRRIGQAPLQKRVQHLLSKVGMDPRHVPSSNLIFTRSRRSADLGIDTESLIDLCWPVHAAALAIAKPKGIVCLGVDTGDRVRLRLRATDRVGSFFEDNNRKWGSHAWRNPDGLVVFCLTHPSIADWTKPATDPSPLLRAYL